MNKSRLLGTLIASLCLLNLFASVAHAVSAGCSAYPTELTRVEGEPGAISLSLGYSNDSASTVTFTTTTSSSAFGPGGSSTLNVGPGVGVAQNPALQTFPLSPGMDTVYIEITSSATGSTVLGSCDYTLTILPADSDTDGDALFDNWETAGGMDVNLDGTLDVLLPGANSDRKDLYLELDCLVKDGDGNGMLGDPSDHSHCPRQDAIIDSVQAFANAPVANSDGTTGIQLHIDTGDLYGAGMVFNINGTGGVTGTYGDLGGGGDMVDETGNEIIDWDGATGDPATSYYDLKAANFDSQRDFVYRYGIFGHQTNARRAMNDCTSGWAEGIPANDFFVTLGGTGSGGGRCWGSDANGFSVGSRAQQAGTLMHEFGHDLGLGHGGGDGVNRKPNYLSVMNYAFQVCSVPADPGGALPGGCDYSPIDLPDLDETSLDECAGVGGGLGFGAMDWDGDMALEGVINCMPPNSMNVSIDINGDDACVKDGDNDILDSMASGDDVVEGTKIVDGPDFTCDSTATPDDEQAKTVGDSQSNPLKGFDDWSSLFYAFRTLPVFAAGIADPVEDEPDPEIIEEAREMLSIRLEPVIVLEKTGQATALPGETVVFDLVARNEGMGPAVSVVLTDTLPDSSVETFDIKMLAVGDEVMESVEFTVADDACPQVITNRAAMTYEDFVGKELITEDTADMLILDVTPPVLEVSVSPDMLWPVNHKLIPIEANVIATDECDPDPEVRLVSITSSESDNGLGDGNSSEDIQGAEFGTDDSAFLLRAERSGRRNGRVYTIVYEAEDDSGNVATAEVMVTVPHSQKK
jgi:uncharacterized repeat protein (TIGR01451 family)